MKRRKKWPKYRREGKRSNNVNEGSLRLTVLKCVRTPMSTEFLCIEYRPGYTLHKQTNRERRRKGVSISHFPAFLTSQNTCVGAPSVQSTMKSKREKAEEVAHLGLQVTIDVAVVPRFQRRRGRSLRAFQRQSAGHVLRRRWGERVGHGAVGKEPKVPETLQLEHRRGEAARMVAPQVQRAWFRPFLQEKRERIENNNTKGVNRTHCSVSRYFNFTYRLFRQLHSAQVQRGTTLTSTAQTETKREMQKIVLFTEAMQ